MYSNIVFQIGFSISNYNLLKEMNVYEFFYSMKLHNSLLILHEQVMYQYKNLFIAIEHFTVNCYSFPLPFMCLLISNIFPLWKGGWELYDSLIAPLTFFLFIYFFCSIMVQVLQFESKLLHVSILVADFIFRVCTQ